MVWYGMVWYVMLIYGQSQFNENNKINKQLTYLTDVWGIPKIQWRAGWGAEGKNVENEIGCCPFDVNEFTIEFCISEKENPVNTSISTYSIIKEVIGQKDPVGECPLPAFGSRIQPIGFTS
ncbi:hypothetical protein M0804_010460 [Polistes exclamans]|nr:hypothetical protein M0804_010460 [Polistes exclamans]